MEALTTLLDRPLWDLALGAAALGTACIVGALAFFWIGFRIAEVSALVGFEGMFGLTDEAPGHARAVPAEVAARLEAIRDRGATRSSLGELAAATGQPEAASSGSQDPAVKPVPADE